MLLTNLSRFIYEDGANEGAGGNGNDNNQQQQQEAPQPQPILTNEDLKNYGFDSAEQFKSFLEEQKEARKPDSAKQKEIETERANFLKYSADNDLLKLEDYNQYEALKGKDNNSLVYEKHLAEFKEDNPDIDAADIDEEAKNDFNRKYNLLSTNEKVKARGEARLAADAAALKNPYEQKYNTAFESYQSYKNVKTTYPEYVKFMDEVISENTPEKVVVKVKDGEQEVDVDVDLTKEQRSEIEKLFKTDKSFLDYSKGEKRDELKAKIAKKITGFIKENNFEKAVEKGYATGHGIGLKSGSNVGASNPFGMTQNNSQESGKVISLSLEESNAKMAHARMRYKGQ